LITELRRRVDATQASLRPLCLPAAATSAIVDARRNIDAFAAAVILLTEIFDLEIGYTSQGHQSTKTGEECGTRRLRLVQPNWRP
jgi:hypothetical protein